jgi:undecaprenyl-diphosphatase
MAWPIVPDLLRSLHRRDEALLRHLNGRGGPAVDRAMAALSQVADHSKLWIGIAGILALAGGRRGRRAAAQGLVSIAFASAIVNGPLKRLSRRQRPSWQPSVRLLPDQPATFSFPSGHAASAFAFAVATGSQARVLLLPLAGLAGAVAYSRIRARVHYPSDIVAGAAVGVVAAAAGSRLVQALDQRRLRRLASAGIEIMAEVPVSALSEGRLPVDEKGEAPLLIAAGGDGTVGAVANRVVGSSAVLGVIPLGTSNDFARSLGIPVDVVGAVALFRLGKISNIDVGRFVSPGQPHRHFVHAATAGLNVRFARLATQASLRHRLGRLTYVVAAALALRERYPFTCRLSFDGSSQTLQVEELAIINAPIFGGFLGLRVSGVHLADGALDVLVIEKSSIPREALAALFAVAGIRRPLRGVRALHLSSLEVHTDQPLEVTLDGELLGTLPASFQVAGEALRIVTPADFDGRA